MKINITQEDFGTLCICALRYCHGRQTYMPGLVQEIVGGHLKELSDKDITVLVQDCEPMGVTERDYGSPKLGGADWIKWECKVRAEKNRREMEGENG